jgi:predicted metalloprotease with PDZ domain
VFDGGTARRAGLAAGDLLVALEGLRISPRNVVQRLNRYRAGDNVTIHYFRRGELRSVEAAFIAPVADTWMFFLAPGASPDALARRKAWLHG